MNRRDILKTTGALALAALAADALAADEHHDHAAMGGHEGMKNPNTKLIEVASDCVAKGQVCVDHCLMLLADGDKEMAACARSVLQTMALCSSLQQLASYQTPQLKALAKVAMDACKECEDECRKHEKKHAVCRDCAESCAACYKECKAITA